MKMDDVNLFTKNKNELETQIQTESSANLELRNVQW